MKYFLPLLIAVFAFAACTQPAKDTSVRNIELLTDSASYSNNNVYSDTVASVNHDKTLQSETPLKKTVARKNVQSKAPATRRPANRIPESSTPNETVSNVPPVTNGGGNSSETATQGPVADAGVPGGVHETEKKGWSKAAQGAVIGGASGAVAGAIISKKKGLGAVVGGVVGAAGGYIIGKNKDKKEAQKQ